jgi:hypothetical protein
MVISCLIIVLWAYIVDCHSGGRQADIEGAMILAEIEFLPGRTL